MFGFSVLHNDESVSVSAAFHSQPFDLKQVYTVYMDVYTMLNYVYYLLSFKVLLCSLWLMLWFGTVLKLN